MAEKTGISWADSTFNPWMGCTKVGPGCDHCYAEALMDERLHRVQWGAGKPRQKTSVAYWRLPVHWNAASGLFRECGHCGWRGQIEVYDTPVPFMCPECTAWDWRPARRRVFCASLADVFDNEVDPVWRLELFDLIRNTPNLDWLILTKRVGNVRGMVLDCAQSMMARTELWAWLDLWANGRPPVNVWLGATVVDQNEADRDLPKLLNVPAAVRFLSIEPLLGAIEALPVGLVDWVIVGGESGPQARPMHVDWVTSIRDKCKRFEVPFLFKQWGEWEICSHENGHFDSNMETNGAVWLHVDGLINGPSCHRDDLRPARDTSPVGMIKVGKKKAGNRLEGRIYQAWPKAKMRSSLLRFPLSSE